MKDMPFLPSFYCKMENTNHIATRVKQFLVQMFGTKIINRDCRLPGLRSPDLTPSDFWLWGQLKTRVYRSISSNLPKMIRFAEWYQWPPKSATLFYCWIYNWLAMCYAFWLWLRGKYWAVINNMNTFCLLCAYLSFDVGMSAHLLAVFWFFFFCFIGTNPASRFLFQLF